LHRFGCAATRDPKAGADAIVEDLLDGAVEQARDRERQRQAGVIAAAFQRDDGLPRDVQPVRQVRLRPAAGGAEVPDAVVHQRRRRPSTRLTTTQLLIPSP
jgi:hypothetical protein